MTLLASLTNRIFIAATLLAIVTTGVAVYVVGLRATREAEVELARGLADAGDLVDQQRRALTAQTLLTARLVADLPRLKGAVETRHAETVAPIAAEYQRQASVDLLVISDRGGGVLTAVPAGAGAPTAAAVARALKGQEVVELLPAESGLLQVATVPITIGLESPDVLGALSLGVRLDAGMAERFKRATHSEVAFSLEGVVRASTLPREHWGALTPLLSAPGVITVAIGDSEYVGRAQPLSAANPAAQSSSTAGAPTALVLQSRTERLGLLRTVYAALGLAAATAILLAIGLSYAVARTITRPLGAHHRDHARGCGDRQSDAQDRATRALGLAGRGRAAAGDDVQHAHRFGRAVPARGRAEGAPAVARAALDGHRARGPQPADDHQGGVAQPAARGAGDLTSARR